MNKVDKITAKEILDRVYELDKKEQYDRAIDEVFEYGFSFGELEEDEEIKFIESLIKEVNIEQLSITVILSFLVCSLRYHNIIPYRQKFFNMVKDEIIKREGPGRVKDLLKGLEGEKSKKAMSATKIIESLIIKGNNILN